MDAGVFRRPLPHRLAVAVTPEDESCCARRKVRESLWVTFARTCHCAAGPTDSEMCPPRATAISVRTP